MDASAFPWDVRPKYARVQELLDDYTAANQNIGRQVCPVSHYFRDHLDDDVLEVEAYVYAHPEWGPFALCESVHMTLQFNHAGAGPDGEAIAAWAQHYLMLNLIRYHPYERGRPAFEAMLKAPRMRWVSPAGAYCALAYLNGSHPNPRRILEKPEVAAKFAAFDLDVPSFPAPDFT